MARSMEVQSPKEIMEGEEFVIRVILGEDIVERGQTVHVPAKDVEVGLLINSLQLLERTGELGHAEIKVQNLSSGNHPFSVQVAKMAGPGTHKSGSVLVKKPGAGTKPVKFKVMIVETANDYELLVTLVDAAGLPVAGVEFIILDGAMSKKETSANTSTHYTLATFASGEVSRDVKLYSENASGVKPWQRTFINPQKLPPK